MRAISKLKDEARSHEQREDWARAIQAYKEVLRLAEESEGQGELPLYNRLGDLYLRMGQPDQAVSFYEQAADRYADSGLYNNAIALCSKGLRYQPERAELYFRLGRFSAALGFSMDARRWFVEYADRMSAVGEAALAFQALEEFADAYDDVESRVVLGRYLAKQGKSAEAVDHLVAAYESALRGGELESAEALKAEILETAPETSLPALDALDVEPAAVGEETDDVEAAELPGFEPTAVGSGDDDAVLDEGDPPAVDLETEYDDDDAYDDTPLPMLDPEVAAAEPLEVDGTVAPDTRAHPEPVPAAAELDEADPVSAAEDPASLVEEQQRRVELAAMTGRADRMVDAFLGLAESLLRAGSETKARAVFQQVLDLDPANAAALAALGPDRTVEPDRTASSEEREEGSAAASHADDYVDLGALVRDDMDRDRTTRFVVSGHPPSGDDAEDLRETLEQFKAKIAENLEPHDLESHYDLGIAFKEMGLVDEAIAQFQMALRAGENSLKIYEELGRCFMQKGQHNIAVKVLERALDLPVEGERDRLGVYYHLGRCFEELGRGRDAKDCYERVAGVDLTFLDVPERLARL